MTAQGMTERNVCMLFSAGISTEIVGLFYVSFEVVNIK
jgi:hypothetical protein